MSENLNKDKTLRKEIKKVQTAVSDLEYIEKTVQDIGLLQSLQDSLTSEYSQERKGIHVSDLIYCPRQSVFRRLDPKPLRLMDLMFFATGASYHTILQSLLRWFNRCHVCDGKGFLSTECDKTNCIIIHRHSCIGCNGTGKKDRAKKEVEIDYEGVSGHIDIVVDGIPVEVKTTRARKHEAKEHYVEQLKCYMAMLGAKIGKILTIGLVNYEQPFQVHDIETTEDENDTRLVWIKNEAGQFQLAIEKKDPFIARHVKGTPMDWKCKDCPYKEPCWGHKEEIKEIANV